MINLYTIGAAVLAASLVLGGTYIKGRSDGAESERARQAEAVALAVANIKAVEQARYADRERILEEQIHEKDRIAASLADDLERLRKRPPRPSVPRDPAADCQGATGRELSAADATFLARLAARADELRAGLAACYAYVDSMN